MDKREIKEKITSYYGTNREYYDKLDVVFTGRGAEAVRRGSFDVAALASEAETILDVGCGSGALLHFLREQFPAKRYYGVDVSPLAIAKAKEKNPGGSVPMTFEVQDIEQSVPFGEGMFDLVIAHEMIEHIVHPDLAITNIARSLKRGGKLFLLAPNRLIRSPFMVQAGKIPDFVKMLFNRTYVNPTIVDPPLDVIGGDSDAVYLANPWELHRMARNAGLRLVQKSSVKCRFIAVKT